MLRLVILSVLGVLCGSATAGHSVDMKIMGKLNHYNLMANCFGHDKMAEFSVKLYKAMEFCEAIQSPMFSGSGAASGVRPFPAITTDQIQALRGLLNNPALSNLLAPSAQNSGWEKAWGQFLNRNRRGADGLLDVDAEDEMEFMEDLEMFKDSMMTKMGNLSCVLTQMEMLDGAGEINMDHYSYTNLMSYLRDTPAGQDPTFVRKLADGMSDCYDISRAWPQKSLDRHPMTKKHGRHMIFFECAKKCKKMNCVKFQMFQYLEAFYGEHQDEKDYGMPGDKYDQSLMAVKVMADTASPEETFVDDFFWGKSKM